MLISRSSPSVPSLRCQDVDYRGKCLVPLAKRPFASKTERSMLTEADMLPLTQHALADWPIPSHLSAILKGGSDRRFYRVHFQDPITECVILMSYTLARPDNPRFVPATNRLEKLGVRVPHVYAHD